MAYCSVFVRLVREVRGQCCRRNLRHTTCHQHLPERVTILRPRHPFEGKSLSVFGAMSRKGRLLLVLILPDGSKSLIPADWTDLASPTQTAPTATTLSSLEDLLHARAVVDALLGRLAPISAEDGNSAKTKESNLAKQKTKPVRSAPRRNRSLGKSRRGTQKSRPSHSGPAHSSSRSPRSGKENER